MVAISQAAFYELLLEWQLLYFEISLKFVTKGLIDDT